MIKKLTATILLILIAAALNAQDRAQQKKDRVFIYSFTIPTDAEKYQYYTFIIPSTISKYIEQNNNFGSVKIIDDIEPYPETSDEQKNREYIKKLREKASTYGNPEYVVSGACSIAEGEITITAYVFNLRGKKVEKIVVKGRENVAVMKEMMDDLSAKIENQLLEFHKDYSLYSKESGYSSFYKAIRGTDFGFSFGKNFILFNWKDLYNDSDFINAYVRVLPWKNYGLMLSGEYFSTNNDNKSSGRSYYEIFGTTLSFCARYGISENISVSASAGGGISYSKIEFQPSGDHSPYAFPLLKKTSTDPSLDISACIEYEFNPAKIRLGASFKRIFYLGEDLNMYSIFIGAGYNI